MELKAIEILSAIQKLLAAYLRHNPRSTMTAFRLDVPMYMNKDYFDEALAELEQLKEQRDCLSSCEYFVNYGYTAECAFCIRHGEIKDHYTPKAKG